LAEKIKEQTEEIEKARQLRLAQIKKAARGGARVEEIQLVGINPRRIDLGLREKALPSGYLT
jgi:hypothetical protein